MSEAVERFDGILRFAIERQISDVLLKSGQRPLYRRVGRLISKREEATLDDAALGEIAARVLHADEAKAFNAGASIVTTYGLIGVGRLRVHVSRQRGGIVLAVRVLPARPPVLRDLRLPAPVAGMCNVETGLVLLVGGRGQGRSTTSAAMIDAVNTTATFAKQIATIESPIEIFFDDKLAWICQRAIGRDCDSAASGVKDALISDSDVIVVDELNNAETLFAVLDAAEAGKLVIAGITALDIAQGFRRLYAMVPPEALAMTRSRIAALFVGALSQRLVPAADGQRRLPACETLVATPQVYGLIREGHDPAVFYEVMAASSQLGMHTIDQSLYDMIQARAVAPEAAMAYAMRPAELSSIRKGTRAESGLF